MIIARIGSVRLAAVTLVMAACSSTTPVTTGIQPAPRNPDDVPGVILVANQQAGSATLIDLKTGNAIEIPVGTGPHETAMSNDGRTGAVTIYGMQPAGNQIALIDLKTAKVTKTLDLGNYRRPHGVTFLPGDKQLIATSEASQNVVVVDIATGALTPIPTNARGSHMLAIDAKASVLYTANVADGNISEIDLTKRAFVKTYPMNAAQTEGVAISADGRFVWVGSNQNHTVTVFDATTKTNVAVIQGVGMPYRVGVAPNGRFGVAMDPEGGFVHVIDATTYKVTKSIAMTGNPQGIYFTPDSRYGFVTLHSTNEAGMIDFVEGREMKRWAVGQGPDGISYTHVPR